MSGWVDGFGDNLDVGEVLEAQEARIAFHARMAVRPHADVDDLKQEARIAIWREAVKHPGDPLHGLAPVVIRRAVTAAAVHQRWTGNVEDRKGGKAKDPLRRPHGSLDLEVGNDDEGAEVTTFADTLVLVANDVLEAVVLAYHYGEIWQAIAELPADHKEYVYMKFWLGLSEREIGAKTGRTAANVNRTWLQVIRPRLQRSLAHLAGVV